MPLCAQLLTPIPASILDLEGQFAMPDMISFEQQIQSGTQGTPTNGNPFAYRHAVLIRPWFHYDGLRNTTVTGSVSYIDYFNVPRTSNYRHSEWRVTALGTLKQPLSGGSLYEQVRFELLNFRDSNAESQHLPRVRFRLGQNLYLGKGPPGHTSVCTRRLLCSSPALRTLASSSKTPDSSRATASSWGPELTSFWDSKPRVKFSSSGSAVNLYFGPVFSIDHTFTRLPMNEKHNRTTAFKDF